MLVIKIYEGEKDEIAISWDRHDCGRDSGRDRTTRFGGGCEGNVFWLVGGEFCKFDRAMIFEDPNGTRILYDA